LRAWVVHEDGGSATHAGPDDDDDAEAGVISPLRWPPWVIILAGLALLPFAYYDAGRVAAGGEILMVTLPFYWLGGKWGVFGIDFFCGLVVIAFGVSRWRARRSKS